MNRYDAMKELIRANSSIVEFAEFGDGVSGEWVNKAEAAIGMKFPKSYEWWLRNYGGGEVGGEEIFSIYEQCFDSVAGGDVVCMYRLSQQHADAQRGRIPICHSDVDGVFCLDASSGLNNGEYPVLSEATGTQYARDFLEFLEKRIHAFQRVG